MLLTCMLCYSNTTQSIYLSHRVVRTAPWRAAALVARVDEVNHRPIQPRTEEEPPDAEQQNVQTQQRGPQRCPWLVRVPPFVVHPHHSVRDNTHHGADERADEADERAKDGDGRRDNVPNQHRADDRANPDDPVADGVVRQVVTVVQDADEDVLAGDLVLAYSTEL